VRSSRIDAVLDEISAYLLFDNNSLERLTLEEFAAQMTDFTRLCAADVAGKSYRVEESLSELVAMLYRRATSMLKECVEVTADTNGLFNQLLLPYYECPTKPPRSLCDKISCDKTSFYW